MRRTCRKVPDAVTAFTTSAISNAGIEHLSNFAALTPNLTFQDGPAFRSGVFNLSIRSIGNGQERWPSVSYIIDGGAAARSQPKGQVSFHLTDYVTGYATVSCGFRAG